MSLAAEPKSLHCPGLACLSLLRVGCCPPPIVAGQQHQRLNKSLATRDAVPCMIKSLSTMLQQHQLCRTFTKKSLEKPRWPWAVYSSSASCWSCSCKHTQASSATAVRNSLHCTAHVQNMPMPARQINCCAAQTQALPTHGHAGATCDAASRDPCRLSKR
jgi:hypothetical protein